ncbi:hypothetical protein D9M72_199560 [compost metagenome]
MDVRSWHDLLQLGTHLGDQACLDNDEAVLDARQQDQARRETRLAAALLPRRHRAVGLEQQLDQVVLLELPVQPAIDAQRQQPLAQPLRLPGIAHGQPLVHDLPRLRRFLDAVAGGDLVQRDDITLVAHRVLVAAIGLPIEAHRLAFLDNRAAPNRRIDQMRLRRRTEDGIGGAYAGRPDRMAQWQGLTHAASQALAEVIEEAWRELRLTAGGLHHADELAQCPDRIALQQVDLKIQPARACVAKATRQALPFQRHDAALQHPVEHHCLDEPALESKHDAAAVMRDAYPFLRGHRTRDGRTLVIQQLVTEPGFAIETILGLQFQRRQRLGQIRHGLPHKIAGSHAETREHCNGRAHLRPLLPESARRQVEDADHTPCGIAERLAVSDEPTGELVDKGRGQQCHHDLRRVECL